jgi:hypothetical protein
MIILGAVHFETNRLFSLLQFNPDYAVE